MAKIIVFGSQKGGAGKSTLTTLAATALSQAPYNLRVVVVDTDPQKSLVDARKYDSKDAQSAPPYEILDLDAQQLQKELPKLDKKYDLVFIDVAGKLDTNLPARSQEIAPVLLNTDLLVIPFTAGNYGLDSTLRYLDFVFDLVAIKRELPRPLQVLGFVNMYVNRWREDKFLMGMIEDIAGETGLRFMINNIGFYNAYRSISTLQSFYHAESKDPAQLNFRKWLHEFYRILQNG